MTATPTPAAALRDTARMLGRKAIPAVGVATLAAVIILGTRRRPRDHRN